MRFNLATLFLCLALSCCGGPQALAADTSDDISTQQNAVRYADASVPPVADTALTTQGAKPTTSSVVTQADSIAPVVNPDGGWNFVPLANGFQQFLLGIFEAVLTAMVAWVGAAATKYLGVHIDLKEAAKDLNLNAYADTVAAQAIAYARQRTGLTDEQLKDVQFRNPFLALAAGFVLKLDPTIWTWVSKNETGVMQWIESHLSPDAALPSKTVDGVGVVAKG